MLCWGLAVTETHTASDAEAKKIRLIYDGMAGLSISMLA